MTYRLRFVQKFQQSSTEAFMRLEKEFIRLERETPGFPQGHRFTPVFSKEPLNTLIWECDFPSLQKAVEAQQFLDNNSLHKQLFDEQVQYFIESYGEIYCSMED